MSDYFIGLRIFTSKSIGKRKFYLLLSLVINLGILGYFKYYNFFIESFIEMSSSIGINSNLHTLNIILPVGISFYTFQTLSYSIDIYSDKLKPAKNIVSFFAFVSFFPQLVAGPIERAKNLLPQFERVKKFTYDYGQLGVKLILWGFAKKVLIADNLAGPVNLIFESHDVLGAGDLILGSVFFAFQIYCDFSGYSDIAIGIGKLFGFDLMTNFNYPYFSKNVSEFWRRWHISLSTWFRDYVFIPLGGSRGSNLFRIRNLILLFAVSGFWHGANWTFIIWGILNGLYYLPSIFLKVSANTRVKKGMSIIVTFAFTCLAWIFFRSNSVEGSFSYIQNIFSGNWCITGSYNFELVLLFIFVAIEWLGRDRQVPILNLGFNSFIRNVIYFSLIVAIILFGSFQEQSFIYFQF